MLRLTTVLMPMVHEEQLCRNTQFVSGEASCLCLMDLVTVPAPLHFKIFYQYLHSKPLLLNPVDFFSVVFLIDINNNYIPLQVKLKEKMRALPSPDVSLMMCLS